MAEAAGPNTTVVKAAGPSTPAAKLAAARATAARTTAEKVAAATCPVARVLVDVPLSHLDKPFDYLVTDADSASAQPGTRVKVRFAGQLLDGFVLERLAESEFGGELSFIHRVVSPERVLTPAIVRLCRVVADRYAGSMHDVVRLAVPPRHAKAEGTSGFKAGLVQAVGTGSPAGELPTEPVAAPRAVEPAGADLQSTPGDLASWRAYDSGEAFLTAVAQGRAARAVWQALPGEDWPVRIAEAAALVAKQGRGALLVVPDGRDMQRVDAALKALLPHNSHVTLTAGLGPAKRYRSYLDLSRGTVKIAVGTRAAMFAPVADLALVAVFDDGDDLLAEPLAPYPHAREVLMLRSALQSCALLIGGFARTAESELLLQSGWARPIVAPRATVRARAPRVEAAGDDYAVGAGSAAAHARISPAAFAAARAALAEGRPVLVVVGRRGYQPGLACNGCRRPARCRHCAGPLGRLASRERPVCRWCGVSEAHFSCPACGTTQLRSTAAGELRTSQELTQAFPKVRQLISAGDNVIARVPDAPAIVVATWGAEPRAAAGYGAALLLDGNALLGRSDLRAGEEAVRRWLGAAALVSPAAAGGRVVIDADVSLAAVQAVIGWNPAGFAAGELAARRELRFPPAVVMASLEGSLAAVEEAAGQLDLPADAEVLGPVLLTDIGGYQSGPITPAADSARALIRVPAGERRVLTAAVKALAVARSARKDRESLRLRIDPDELF